MTTFALLLVLFSGVAHAGWNFFLKGAYNKEVFVWWIQIVISVIFLPLAFIIGVTHTIDSIGWVFVVGTALLHFFYFLFLARAYKHNDLSQIYPLVRGTGTALVPILGALILNEDVSVKAILGVLLIIIGMSVVYWSGNMRSILVRPWTIVGDVGILYAFATGLLISGYAIWDKVGVSYVPPLFYMYLMALGTGLIFTPYILGTHGLNSVVHEWKMNYLKIVVAGVLTFIAYGLVLSALEISKVSYVWPARELGLVVAVILGSTLAKESFGFGRVFGSTIIIVGVFSIAFFA